MESNSATSKALCKIAKEYAAKLALPESVFGYMLEVISEDLPTVCHWIIEPALELARIDGFDRRLFG